tara:strand:+ start:64951 stop:65277 length:327 start_codon:yes stop_codon:yes gene_type:complete
LKNEVEWNPKALQAVQEFPIEVKRELGYLIYRLQLGEKLNMPFSRSMPSVSKGSHELRVKGADGIFRAFYFLKVEGKVLIFHAFQKKTQKTPKKEIELGKSYLKEMLK